MRPMFFAILVLTLAFMGCQKDVQPEQAPINIPYAALANNQGTPVEVGPVKVGGAVRRDTVTFTSCEMAKWANDNNEVSYQELDFRAQAQLVEKGVRERIVSSSCSSGTGTCTFLCGGQKYTITGIPDGCRCIQSFGYVLVYCTNDCAWGQATCTIQVQ